MSDAAAKWRAEGDKQAKLRNDCYERSKAAYAKGDGALAKKLSEEGKKHQKLMEEAHKKASDAAFKEKNASRGLDEIDLHGLRKKEAIAKLEERLSACEKARVTKLRIITGKGLHSKDNKAEIKPVVISYLKKKGYKFEINDVNEGCMEVQIHAGGCILF